MSREGPVWPRFLIAGVPRTGTTTLYHCLRQHPQTVAKRAVDRRLREEVGAARGPALKGGLGTGARP